ncbi:nucleotidyltransferase [Rossellomorea vietnamensis]|uniref:nucleotidyltransferase n=1 Tax=Rossellomorea vietnamensis TaxID=218284 RepID=UPI003D2BACF5
MLQIKEIGRFCPMDSEGFIVNDSSMENIQPVFLQVVEEVIERYRTHLKGDLHSIYIRGSVPRGLGIEGVSDLDTIAVTNKGIEDIDLNWVEKAGQEVNNRFPQINGVEFSFYYIEDILQTESFSMIPFMIKTHSVCVYGRDIKVQLPDYKADITLGNEHLVNIADQIELAKKDLNGNEDVEDIMDCCGWIMKIIVRAGLALVINEEKVYTRDQHYPEKESDMKQVLQYAINPVGDPVELLDFLDEMGEWMVLESEKWLHIYNQGKIKHLKI